MFFHGGVELHLGCSLGIVTATLAHPARDSRPLEMHCSYDEIVQLSKPSNHCNGNSLYSLKAVVFLLGGAFSLNFKKVNAALDTVN